MGHGTGADNQAMRTGPDRRWPHRLRDYAIYISISLLLLWSVIWSVDNRVPREEFQRWLGFGFFTVILFASAVQQNRRFLRRGSSWAIFAILIAAHSMLFIVLLRIVGEVPPLYWGFIVFPLEFAGVGWVLGRMGREGIKATKGPSPFVPSGPLGPSTLIGSKSQSSRSIRVENHRTHRTWDSNDDSCW